MAYKEECITTSNVESIVSGLSENWIENETWLVEFALKLNSRYKELRDDLRENRTAWSHLQYSGRLAYHYYVISSNYYHLFGKYKVDLQSVIKWMEKCLDVIKQIPHEHITERLRHLSDNSDKCLEEMELLKKKLNSIRNASRPEKYAVLSTALGDVIRNVRLDKFLSDSETKNRTLWEKKLQNIILVRVLTFLEDSLSNPNNSNLLCASSVSLSLGNVYSLIGITFLSERFKNTHMRLLIACSSPTHIPADPRKKMKNIIVECIRGKYSLHHTKDAIEEMFGQKLSNIDATYIERKYYAFCFEEFIKESVDYLKEFTEQKNRRVIMSILPQLKCSESLLQIPHPLTQMEYYSLLKQNCGLTRKEDETYLMKDFKRKCFMVITDYINLAKNELLFLETFIEFLGSVQDDKYLEYLRRFCISDAPLGELIQNVLNLEKDVFGEELLSVQLLAEQLKNDTDLFYVDEFKETVCAYLKPPEIQMVKLDGRSVLEVCGGKIVISKITNQDIFQAGLDNPSCEEVRFIATNLIRVDEHFTKSLWHGKNIVVKTKTLIIQNPVVWDVSGNDCSHTFSSCAGTLPDGEGKPGEDGLPGESGGNVHILVETIVNSDKFSIKSNGGKGSNGQAGGKGRDGHDGKSITVADFRKKFPPVAKYYTSSRIENVQTTLRSILDFGSTIKTKWYRYYEICHKKALDNIIADLKRGIIGHIFIEAKTRDGNDITFSFGSGTLWGGQGFLLFKGSPGKPGFKGGEPGWGGQGGFPGEVIVKNPYDFQSKFDLIVKTRRGEDGADGKGGISGSSGKNGCDRGYMDYFISNIFGVRQWPKEFGSDNDSILHLKYDRNKDRERIWCPYKEKYVDMEFPENVQTIQTFQESMDTRCYNKRESRNKATKKKTILHGEVITRYKHHFEKAVLQNMFRELEDTNAALIQAIAENQKEHEKEHENVNEHVEVRRSRLLNVKRKAAHSMGEIVAPIELKIRLESVDPVTYLANQPLPIAIDSWKALKGVQVTKSQLNKLYSSFDVIAGQISDPKQVADIRTMLLEKYRFATLFEISEKLRSAPCSDDTQKIDATSAIKYLSFGKDGSEIIWHKNLGRINQYLVNSNEQGLKNISRYCKGGFINGELKLKKILRPIKSFLLEAQQSGDPDPNISKWFHKFNFYSDKQKRGFITYPEPPETLDSEFSEELTGSMTDGEWEADRGSILHQFFSNIIRRGCGSISYIELLAYIYEVNIRLYKESNNCNYPYLLKGNFNLESDSSVHLLYRSDESVKECILLDVDINFWKLEQQRVSDGVRYSKVLNDTMKLKEKLKFDEYLKNPSFEEGVSEEELEYLGKEPAVDIGKTVDKILDYFSVDDKKQLEVMLRKLTPEYTGRTRILDSVLKKFSYDGRHISVKELMCFINSTVNSAAEGRNCQNIYEWIVVAYPQEQWINEVLLIDIETFFKKSLPETLNWRKYMCQIKNKRILLTLREKLQRFANNTSLDIQCLEDALYKLSIIPTGSLQLYELGIAEWPLVLEEPYWQVKLTQLLHWNVDEFPKVLIHTLAIVNMYGSDFVDKLFSYLLKRKNELEVETVSTILYNIYNETWCFSDKEFTILENCENIDKWVRQLEQEAISTGPKRGVDRLVKSITTNSNTSNNVKNIANAVSSSFAVDPTSSIYKPSILGLKQLSIREYKESHIENWVKAFKERRFKSDIGGGMSANEPKKSLSGPMYQEMLAVVDRAIELKEGFRLSNVQKLAVLILLENDKNTLAQVATGEGKSLIVVAMSIIKALECENVMVDVITSSSVLAKRDAKRNEGIYQMFGVSVSHNCNEDVEKRKAAYSNQVVYGDLSDFQRDHLLHDFYGINILGDRKFEIVVVDEVDSMLLDKGNNMLYLSHDIPGLDKLESVYIFIWQLINQPCSGRDNILNLLDSKIIRNAVLHDLYPLLEKTDIKELDSEMTDHQASTIWERLKELKIIDSQDRLLIAKVDYITIEKVRSSNFNSYTDRLCYLINERLCRDRQIRVPNYLKPFIEIHLDTWINNAIHAFFMKPGENYVVDVDRTGMSTDRNANVIIIDKDTGTDQINSQWEEALHQFLQLKHGCKLSIQTFKAVFISNVSYFNIYKKVYGLTGTLGSHAERRLLKEVYKSEFVTIPTAKAKQFEEYQAVMCSDERSWCCKIKSECDSILEKRSILVICESVNDVQVLRQCFNGMETFHLHTYSREYEEFDVTHNGKELGPGHLIIATNLAGRGTDIKISKDLESAGGLHVILSYLPNNVRIEQQAFGRAARCGDKGSGQLIINSSNQNDAGGFKILNLKLKRDKEELMRISEIKEYYENRIKTEELYFSKFKKRYVKLKQLFDENSNVPEEVKKILLRNCLDKWAFWLDENAKLIETSTSSKSKSNTKLQESMDKFISQLERPPCDASVDNLISWVGKHPMPVIQLGKHFFRSKKYEEAKRLFEHAIMLEPDFSEAAHYYNAGALGNSINWESESDSENKKKIENELRQAARMFDNLRDQAIQNFYVVSTMKRTDKHSILPIEGYKEQQEKIAKLYHKFSCTVDVIVGQAVTPQSFTKLLDFKDVMVHKLHSRLLQKGILKYRHVSLGNIPLDELVTKLDKLSRDHNIPVTDLKSFLNKHDGIPIKSYRDFIAAMKEDISLPSKEHFWKELVLKKILINEIKFVIVDKIKLTELDPSLLEVFSGHSNLYNLKPEEENLIFLNEELLPEQENIENVLNFVKEDLIKLIGRERYLALKQAEVFSFNRKCQIDFEKLKSLADEGCNDSVTLGDLTKKKVSETDAKVIIQELIDQQVIAEITADRYCLVTHYKKFDSIDLSCPIYKCITISLLNECFSYSISLQKLFEQMEAKSPFIIRLKSKPYLSLFRDLYDSEIITPIKVGKGKDWEEVVENMFSSKMSKSKFNELLTDDFFVPQETADELLINMVENNWLNYPKLNPVSQELEIEDEEKWESLHGTYKIYEKTARKILENAVKMSKKVPAVSNALDRMKSILENVEVPSFGLIPLPDALPEGNFSYAQEIHGFNLNGLDVLLSLEEKKYTWKMILSTTILTIMGLLKVVIGGISSFWSFALAARSSFPLIGEGIADLVIAIRNWFSGYANHKLNISSFLPAVGNTLLSSVFKGFKGIVAWVRTCVGWILTGVAAYKATTTNNDVANLGLKLIKQATLTNVKEVGYGLANMLVEDDVVEDFFESLRKLVVSEAMTEIEKEVENHCKSSKLLIDFNTKSKTDALSQQLFENTSMWEQLHTTARKISNNLSQGIAKMTQKNLPGDSHTFLPTEDILSVWSERSVHLSEIRKLTKKLLDGLTKDIDKHMTVNYTVSDRTTLTDSTNRNESDFYDFKYDIAERQIKENCAQIILQHIEPLLKDGAQDLMRLQERKVKEFFRSYKEGTPWAELFAGLKQPYAEIIEKAGDVTVDDNTIMKEYHQNLMKLLSKTWSPKLFADIIRENVPMDETCLNSCVVILPFIVGRLGIQGNFKFVIENGEDSVKQEGERIIRLRINDNNNGLFQNLSKHFNLEMSDLEFRDSVAKMIEADGEMQSLVNKMWRKLGISARPHGELDGCYTFNSETDADLRRRICVTKPNGISTWVEDTLTTVEMNEQRTRAYNAALQKINEIVTGNNRIKHWEDCQLVEPSKKIKPEDFNRSVIFYTIRITSHGMVSHVLYPAEIHTTIKVKVGGNVLEYDVEISSRNAFVNEKRDPLGPHIGFKIKRKPKSGSETVVGRYLINSRGNERLPRRERESTGRVYIADDGIPKIRPYQLFFGPRIMGVRLERALTDMPL